MRALCICSADHAEQLEEAVEDLSHVSVLSHDGAVACVHVRVCVCACVRVLEMLPCGPTIQSRL